MNNAILTEIWRERDAWAHEATTGKEAQKRARFVALSLGVGGAVLGTAAGFFESDAEKIKVALGILSGIALALAAFFGREMLTPERESRWARCRILAEALQRECWRFLMQVPPYCGEEASEALHQRAEQLISNIGLERNQVTTSEKPKIPAPSDIEDYIQQRASKQAVWYEESSHKHDRQHTAYQRWTLGLGAISIVVSFVGSAIPNLLALVPVMTTATGALVAWIQASRANSLVSVYQATATQLRLRVAQWRDGAKKRESMTELQHKACEVTLVEFCEEVMARENDAWKAELLDKVKSQEVFNALKKVYEGDAKTD